MSEWIQEVWFVNLFNGFSGVFTFIFFHIFTGYNYEYGLVRKENVSSSTS